MLFPIAVLLLGASCQLPVISSADFEVDESSFCTHDPSVEAFAGSFLTAVLVENGFQLILGIEVTGKQAAKSAHDIVLAILQKEGLCGAEWVASTAGFGFRSLEKISLATYTEKTSYEVGQFLFQKGLLDCSNAISRALEFYSYVRKESKSLDNHKFESYQRGHVLGLLDFIHKHGLPLEESANDLAYLFYKEFSSSRKGDCKKPKN